MNKGKFYIFVIAQVVILFMIAGQHYFIESYGTSFNVYIDESYDYSFFQDDGDVYVEYEITEIPVRSWGINEPSIYNDLVYVRLEKNASGVFEVIDVADHKLYAYDDNQVILKAKYQYDYNGKYHVDYRIKQAIDIDYFFDVDRNEKMVAHFQVAPWGQIKLIDVKNAQ